jgi:alkylation response protein AidB-like acyl-CoA dehydrogenase
MNSLYFTKEHELFRKSLTDILDEEIRPYADEWEETETCPREIFKKLGKLDYLGLLYPEEVGGCGVDYFYNVVFAEELSKCGVIGLASSILIDSQMASPALYYFGTPEQKEKYLRPVLAGDKIIGLGLTEPNHGSDLASIETEAVKKGDKYIINGAKTYITNGTMADYITLAARTGGKGYKGVSLFIFETNTPGFKVGKKLKKMGFHSGDTAELFFDNCEVPAENLIGEEGKGFKGIMAGLENERIIGAVCAYAAAEYALELSIKYARERNQFGKPIGDFQAVSHMLAEMATEIEAAKHLTLYAAWLHSEGKPCIKEVQIAKLFSTEMANTVAYKAVQIHGGFGYMRECQVERIYRDVRLMTIAAGTSEIMKNIIAKQIGVGEGIK